jgi:hypothetical protein
MSLRGDIYALLVADAGVIGQISTRVFHEMAPQGTARPYVTLSLIFSADERHMGAAAGITRATLQADIWATTTATLDAAGDAVRDALQGLQRTTMGSTDLRSATLTAERDEHEIDSDGGETILHRRVQEYSVWYARSVPTF